MIVTIIETGNRATEELILIDPKTGVNWIGDLMGNHGALPAYDDDTDTYKMTQDDYNWWADLTRQYQAADDRYYELRQSLDEDDAMALEAEANAINCDLEYYPAALQDVCDKYDNEESN